MQLSSHPDKFGPYAPALIFAVCVLTRLPFTSGLLYNMDSVQFALALDHFDVALHQPQPPGYFLYVTVGRLARLFIPDDNTALIAVSMLASGITAAMVYAMARRMYGHAAGMTAAAIAITSPLFWLHGEVALSYMPEAMMSVVVAFLCYRVLKGEHSLYWAAAVALAVAGGVRQNTMVFLLPLWAYSMKGIGIRRMAAGLVIFGVSVLAWCVPMLHETGGYERYQAALSAHWLDSNWRGIHLHWVVFNAKYMSYYILGGLVLAAVPMLDFALGALKGRADLPADRETALFFVLWILPAFLFHLIIFTHPAVPGHALIYMVGLIVIAARAVTYTAGRISAMSPGISPVKAGYAIACIIAVVNAVFFIFGPYPLSARAIRTHDTVLANYIYAIRANFSPSDTEIVGADRFFFSYRHAMYYLPEFRVHDTVLLTTPEGRRLFWGQGLVTRRSRYIEFEPATTRVVDFINYNREFDTVFPQGASVMDAGDGFLLAYYDGRGLVKGIKRLSGLLPPDNQVPGP